MLMNSRRQVKKIVPKIIQKLDDDQNEQSGKPPSPYLNLQSRASNKTYSFAENQAKAPTARLQAAQKPVSPKNVK